MASGYEKNDCGVNGSWTDGQVEPMTWKEKLFWWPVGGTFFVVGSLSSIDGMIYQAEMIWSLFQ